MRDTTKRFHLSSVFGSADITIQKDAQGYWRVVATLHAHCHGECVPAKTLIGARYGTRKEATRHYLERLTDEVESMLSALPCRRTLRQSQES